MSNIYDVDPVFSGSRRCIDTRIRRLDGLALRVFSVYGGISSSHWTHSGGTAGIIVATAALTSFVVRHGADIFSRSGAHVVLRRWGVIAAFQTDMSHRQGVSDATAS